MQHLLALLLALVIAGCGGGGMSEAEFRAEARRICDAGAARADSVTGKVFAEARRKKLDGSVRHRRTVVAVTPIEEDTMRRLEALDPPEEIAPRVDELVRGVREGLQLADAWTSPKSRGGLGHLQNSRQLEVLGVELRKIQSELGLKGCVPAVVN